MRAVIYLRISQDRTGEELGITRQREDALRLVEQRGWTVVAEYVDNDMSAKTGSKPRPGFEAVLAVVAASEVDAIVSWSLDRLNRNRRDELRLVETCQPRNTVIALVRGSDIDLTTPAGRMTADVLAAAARHEVETMAARLERRYAQAARDGVPHFGGSRPMGFEPDRVTHRPAEAAALRTAYRGVLAGGSLADVARAWNVAGLESGKPARGKLDSGASAWSPSSVRRVLCNPRNAGLRAHRGEIVGPAAWPAIVDEDQWRAVVAVLTDPGRSRITSARSLLGGLARCGVCSGSVEGNTRRGYDSYRCADGRHVHRRAADVDHYVTEVVLARLAQPDAAEVFATPCDGVDVTALRAEAAVVRARLDQVAAEFADDDAITPGQMRTMTERLRARLAGVEQAIADAGRESALTPLLDAGDIRAAWGAMSRSQRRGVVSTLIEVRLRRPGRGARVFDPDTVEIAWRTP